jgi:CheY-like chemotaxis protein
MVFGFVSQSDGYIDICSQAGTGTTVRLYFPRCHEEESAESMPKTTVTVGGGGETILIVEDNADVRLTAVDLLTQLGYKVLTASDGDAAVAILQSGAAIDLLFTDVVMPGKVKSDELARIARALPGNTRVLFTSGYTRDIILHHGRLDPGVSLLSKPYRRDELARKVRSVLESPDA